MDATRGRPFRAGLTLHIGIWILSIASCACDGEYLKCNAPMCVVSSSTTSPPVVDTNDPAAGVPNLKIEAPAAATASSSRQVIRFAKSHPRTRASVLPRWSPLHLQRGKRTVVIIFDDRIGDPSIEQRFIRGAMSEGLLQAIGIPALSNRVAYGMLQSMRAEADPYAAGSGQCHSLYVGGRHLQIGAAFVSQLGLPMAGGTGATSVEEGIDVLETELTNCLSVPVEASEMECPVRICYCRLQTDSGGSGQHRGGFGYTAEVEILANGLTLSRRWDRHTTSPRGLKAGLPATPCGSVLRHGDGTREAIPFKALLALEAGDCFMTITNGDDSGRRKIK